MVDFIRLSLFLGGAVTLFAVGSFAYHYFKEKKEKKKQEQQPQMNQWGQPMQPQMPQQVPQPYMSPRMSMQEMMQQQMAQQMQNQQPVTINAQGQPVYGMSSMGMNIGNQIPQQPMQQPMHLNQNDLHGMNLANTKPQSPPQPDVNAELLKQLQMLNDKNNKLEEALFKIRADVDYNSQFTKPQQTIPAPSVTFPIATPPSEKQEIKEESKVELEKEPNTIYSSVTIKIPTPEFVTDDDKQKLRVGLDDMMKRHLKALKKDIKKANFDSEINYEIE